MSDPPAGADRPPGRRRDDTEPLPVVGPAEPAADGTGADARASGDHGDGRRSAAWWPWAVLVALVAVLAFAVANAWLASSVEGRLAEEAERELGGPIDVELHGFPVGFRALTGEVPAAELRGREVPLPGAGTTLTELHVTLEEVRLDRDRGRLEAASADIEMRFDEAGVEDLLGALGRLPLVDLELQPGTLRVNVAGFAVADAVARAEGGDLVVGLAAPLDRLAPELRLSDFPLGVRVEDVVLREGELELHGRAAPLVVGARG